MFDIDKGKFVERFEVLRIGSNMTMVDIAKMLGISKQAVHQWIVGKNFPSVEMLGALAGYFGVSIDYLVGRDVSSDCPLPTVTPDELALVEKLRALPPEKRRAIEMLLD